MNPNFAQLRAAASELLARAGLASRAGLTFAGKRDIYAALGYERAITLAMYRDRYRRNGVARRIVRAMPVATWRGGAELVEDEDPEVITAFEEAWAALAERLQVWPTFQKADVLAGRGEYAIILIAAPGEWHTELPRGLKPESLAYLQPYSQEDAQIDRFVEDGRDRRYGEAELYKIQRTSRTGGKAASAKLVHWSRVIHVAPGALDDNVYAEPRLEAVWNDLDDLDKVKGGGAEAFWLRANRGTQLDLDPELEWDEKELKKLGEEVDEYIHNLRRVVRTKGVTMKDLGSEVAAFDKNIDSILKLISVTTEIPYRILTGSERGQLASEQDDDNWTERVNDRRLSEAAPLVRQLVDRLIDHGALPRPTADVPGGYAIRWPDMQDLSADERLAQGEKAASINQKQGETVITPDEIRDRYLGLPPLEEVDGDDALDADLDPDPDEDEDEEAERGQRAAAGRRRRSGGSTRLHRAADAQAPRVARVFTAAFADVRRSLSLAELEAAFIDGPQATERLLMGAVDGLETALQGDLVDRLRDALVAGARAGVSSPRVAAAAGLRTADVQLVGSFDLTNPEAQRWAQQHAGALISRVTTETRLAVRAIIDRAFAEGITPRAASRLIRPLVGLTERQAMAVINLRFTLLESTPGALIKAGRVSVRVPKGGVTPDFIQRVAGKYAERLQRQRAMTIARHETMEASNEGQHQLWRQAASRGDLSAATLRTPIITPDERLCPICAEMDGQRVALDQPFTLPDGTQKMNPPFHVTCRCSQGLVADAPRTAHAA